MYLNAPAYAARCLESKHSSCSALMTGGVLLLQLCDPYVPCQMPRLIVTWRCSAAHKARRASKLQACNMSYIALKEENHDFCMQLAATSQCA